MRRLVALLILAAVAAPWCGANLSTAAVHSGGRGESNYGFAHEVYAIHSSPGASCYFTALWGVKFEGGAGLGTYALPGVTAWANRRIEGLAVEAYAREFLAFSPSAADLAAARAELVTMMSAAAASTSQTCGQSADEALNGLPPSVQDSVVMAQAAGKYVLTKVPNHIGTDSASLRAFYNAHRSEYDNICIRVAVVLPENIDGFQSAVANGASPVKAVQEFSLRVENDGQLGCFDASTNARDVVRGLRLNQWSAPQSVSYQGLPTAAFFSVISRTPQPLNAATQALVLADIKRVNDGAVTALRDGIFQRVGVRVNPQLGRFANGQSGLGIYPPASPDLSLVPNDGNSLSLGAGPS